MTTQSSGSSLLSMLPARYSKFAAVLVGLAITYLTIYGTTWHLDPALIMIGTALGVYGVPNGPPPVVAVPVPVIESTEVITAAPPPPSPPPAPAPRPPAPAPSPAPQPVPPVKA